MKRAKIYAGVLFILMILMVSRDSGAEVVEVSRDIHVRRLSEHVWLHTTYTDHPDYGRVPANGVIVVDSGEAVLVDTPWNDEQTEMLLDFAEGRFDVDFIAVVPGHSHEDCMGGLGACHRRGLMSFASELTAVIAREQSLPVPKTEFADSLRITCGALELFLYHPGAGHTVDNSVTWISADDVLFGGCLIKALGARGLGYTGEADIEAWPVTVDRVAARFPRAETVVPGHGPTGDMALLSHTRDLCVESLKTKDAE